MSNRLERGLAVLVRPQASYLETRVVFASVNGHAQAVVVPTLRPHSSRQNDQKE
jgi:hypothetical protein